jgi:hypothetical protein
MNLLYRKRRIEYSPNNDRKEDQIETFRDVSVEK